MGGVSSWFSSLFGSDSVKRRLVFLGCDNAGKTTLLDRLTRGVLSTHAPTGHAQKQVFNLGGTMVSAIDVGGHKSARAIWRNNLFGVDGLVFVVDASDPERFTEVRSELTSLLAIMDDLDASADADAPRKRSTPILVLGNKCDRAGASNRGAFIEALGIADLVAETQQSADKKPDVKATTVLDEFKPLVGLASTHGNTDTESGTGAGAGAGAARGDYKSSATSETVSGLQSESRSSTTRRHVNVFMCSVVRNFGVSEGFRWLKAEMK